MARLMDGFMLGDCEVLASRHRIRRPGHPAASVEPKAMAVLLCLAATNGAVVAREAIFACVWPGRYVTEHVLSRSISALRKALGDDARSPRYIETIHTRGFRLLQPVAPLPAGGASAALAPIAPTSPSSASESPPAEPATPSAPGRSRRWERALVAATIAAVGAMAAVVAGRTGSASDAPAPLLVPITAERGSELDPALSPDGRQLVFARNGGSGDGYDLFVVAIDGGAPRRLTRPGGRASEPAWRPDAATVAFVRSTSRATGLWEVTLATGVERQIAALAPGTAADLAWAPDGRALYVADRPTAAAPSAVARIELRDGTRRWVTRPAAGTYGDRDLALSPEGSRIAFARAVVPGLEDLYVAAVAGGAPRRLTHDGASINGLAWLLASDEILFSSSRDGTSRLWRVPARGDAPPILASGLPDGALDPAYSAAAGRLVFERRTFDTDLWRLGLGEPGTRRRQHVAPSTRWDAAPSLAGAGGRLALVSDRSGAAAPWVARLPGALTVASRPDPGVRHPPAFGRPAWSPDGQRLAVAEVRAGQTDIVTIDLATGARAPVADGAANQLCPVFTADGAGILFTSDAGGAWSLWRADGPRPPRRLADGIFCPRPDPAGGDVYHTRPGSTGIWRTALGDGTVVPVPGARGVSPWTDWDLGANALYLRPVGDEGPSGSRRIWLGEHPLRVEPLPELPAAPFAGLGLAAAADDSYVVYATLEGSDADLLLVDGFR